MASIGDEAPIDDVTRISQIIGGALITGVLFFLGIASVIGLREPEFGTLVTYVALALAAVILPLSFLVPHWVANRNRRAIAAGTWAPPSPGGSQAPRISPEAIPTDADKLAMAYLPQFIVGAALLEGSAFFAGIAYFLGQNPIALGLALLLVGGLILRFPTRHRVQLWVEKQRDKLVLERQSGA
jgi:hypothetical protein